MPGKTVQIAIITTVSAILLWGSVKLGGSYRMDLEVPFDLVGVPAGLAPGAPLPETVELTFRGSGWQLMYLLWDADLGISIDVQSASSHQRVITLGNVTRIVRAPEGVEVTHMTPDTVVIVFEAYEERVVPLHLEFDLSCADGYGLSGKPVLIPESVTVSGAHSLVSSIRHWDGGVIEAHGLTASARKNVPLKSDASGMLTVAPSSIEVALSVQPIAERRIGGVTVRVQSVPPGQEVVLIPPRVELLVRGGIEQLSALDVNDCEAIVEFTDLSGDTVRSVAPQVSVPSGLTIVSILPERCQFVIRRSG